MSELGELGGSEIVAPVRVAGSLRPTRYWWTFTMLELSPPARYREVVFTSPPSPSHH